MAEFSSLNGYVVKDATARKELKKYISQNIYLGTYFDFDSENKPKLNFVTSLDGFNFSDLIIKDMTVDGKKVDNIYLRDPHIYYIEKTKLYYLLTAEAGSHITIYTSSDLRNWKKNIVNISNLQTGSDVIESWAPEMIIFDEDIYFLLTYRKKGEKFQEYLSKCTDITNFTCEQARKLNLNYDDNNLIDGDIIKVNNLYYIAVKNDESATVIIETSTDLINWTVVNDNVNNGLYFEGMQLLHKNNKFYLYVDCYDHLRKIYGVMQTEDVTNFGKIEIIESLRGLRHGHFTILNKECSNYVSLIEEFNQQIRVFPSHSGQLEVLNNDVVVASPNVLYVSKVNSDITIDIVNPYNLRDIPFVFFANNNASITINKVYFNNGNYQILNKKIQNSKYQNEKLIYINLVGSPAISQAHIYKDITSELPFNPANNITVDSYHAWLYDDHIHIDMGLTVKSAGPGYGAFDNSKYQFAFNTMLRNDKNHNLQLSKDGKMNNWTNPTNGSITIWDTILIR